MSIASRFALTCLALLLAVLPVASALAQSPIEKLRQSLIAPWLITVQGDLRGGLLRINEIAQESEGSYILSSTHGWIDGVQQAARVELIQSGQELRLVLRSGEGNLYSFRQSPGGDFVGTFKSARGVELPVTLAKLTEDQVQQKAREATARMAARVFADEDKDWGVVPTNTTRSGRLHAPTPTTIPGAKTIRTMELSAMLRQSPPPVLVDVLGGDGHRTIAGAHWLREPGEATIGNAGMGQFARDLEKLTAGRKSIPIVFFLPELRVLDVLQRQLAGDRNRLHQRALVPGRHYCMAACRI